MGPSAKKRRGSRLHHAAVYFGLAEPDPTPDPRSTGPQRRLWFHWVTFVFLLGIGVALALRRSADEALGWAVAAQLAWWAEAGLHNDGRFRRRHPMLAEFVSDLLFRVPFLFGGWAALWADRSLWNAAFFSLSLGITTAALEAYGTRDAPEAADLDRLGRG